MDLNSISNVISVVGFPIVCCGALAYYVKYIVDKDRDEIQRLNELHRDQLNKITDALNNNTVVIQELKQIINAIWGGQGGET